MLSVRSSSIPFPSCISGSFSGGSIYHHGSTSRLCTGAKCPSATVIWLSIFGGITGLVLLIFGISYYIKYRNGRPSHSNAVFIASETTASSGQEKNDISIFKSGYWKSRYFQYGRWHDPCRFSLSFEGGSMKVTGSGSDDVGKFTIDGAYSMETSRLALTKRYQRGSGNLSENLGHHVTIQLTWNAQYSRFEGQWYVETSKYHGEDKFELKFDGHHPSTVYAKV